jgi:hypothetical protein
MQQRAEVMRSFGTVTSRIEQFGDRGQALRLDHPIE